MAYRVHRSARPVTAKDFWWLSVNGNLCQNNPFIKQNKPAKYHSFWSSSLENDPQEPIHLNPIGEIIIKPTKYQLMLDMLHFELAEIQIRAVHNGFYVNAAHKQNGYVTHHFYREYVLPHDIDPNQAKSWITPEHILFIEAPKVYFDPKVHFEDSNTIDVEIVKS